MVSHRSEDLDLRPCAKVFVTKPFDYLEDLKVQFIGVGRQYYSSDDFTFKDWLAR